MLETFPEAGGRLNIHQGKSILLQPWDVAFPLLYARLPFWKDPKLGSWWKLQILWFLASCLTLITMLSLGWCLVAIFHVNKCLPQWHCMNPSLPFGRWIIMPAVTQKSVNVLLYGAPANIFPLVTGCHWLCLSMVHKLEMASSAPTRIEMGPNIVGIGKPHSHTCCAGDFTAAVQSTNVELWVLWYNHSCSFSFGMSWLACHALSSHVVLFFYSLTVLWKIHPRKRGMLIPLSKIQMKDGQFCANFNLYLNGDVWGMCRCSYNIQ